MVKHFGFIFAFICPIIAVESVSLPSSLSRGGYRYRKDDWLLARKWQITMVAGNR